MKPPYDTWETSLMKGLQVIRSAELELGNIVPDVFTPVLGKHPESHINSISSCRQEPRFSD